MVSYGRMIVPIGPISRNYSITSDGAHQLLNKIPGALLVRYTFIHREQNGNGEWYGIICDEFNGLDSLDHKYRRDIKKGLQFCEIRQVDASYIAKHGFGVYLSAFSRYQGSIKSMTIDGFKNMIRSTIDFDDIYHYWGAFYQGNLIAYMVVVVHGSEEANISVGKFNPKYLKQHPSDGLFYSICQHYLQNESFSYINAGFRNLSHKTGIQQYLLRKFPFKKRYLNLGITYNPILHYYLKLSFPFRSWLGQIHPDLESIYRLEEIRRTCNTQNGNNIEVVKWLKENLKSKLFTKPLPPIFSWPKR